MTALPLSLSKVKSSERKIVGCLSVEAECACILEDDEVQVWRALDVKVFNNSGSMPNGNIANIRHHWMRTQEKSKTKIGNTPLGQTVDEMKTLNDEGMKLGVTRGRVDWGTKPISLEDKRKLGEGYSPLLQLTKEVSTVSTKFESFRAQHFRMLMENLCVLEETFVDYEAWRLEKAIILQLGEVGALELFNVCLSRSVGTSLVTNYAVKVDDYKDKVVVQSSKKKENKTRRKREFVATTVSSQSLTLKANH
ncbi:hypothetical protein JHK82_027762 [Glycine max]|nr:hypothetical protein JHK82_027762 [Glycine max]